ncbi:Aste57867_14854 [Aphanomyces stellatus]|uniref:Aste57867_14854 protein n=1 Tax=Aphanomyces stellatus TaxID=120398 RepID=A0A485L1R9_9STRA|nr:hypothetical protein As57867_014798 [Aphanomyces stellatus]VFT91672.1 Aste57867_14854 [Aphanomyces stellatus]
MEPGKKRSSGETSTPPQHAKEELMRQGSPLVDSSDVSSDGSASDMDLGDDDDDNDDEHVEFFKVLVVGMAKSGKTSLIRRLVHNTFSDEYKTTVGADYFEKTVPIDARTHACVQIWDIAGQDRFAKLTRRYFSNADGAIIVCDITSEYTIHAVMDWKRELDAWCGFEHPTDANKLLPVILVANKCDLLVDIATALESGITMQKMVTETGIDEWFRVSAKSGEKVDAAMTTLVQIMNKRLELKSDASLHERHIPLSRDDGIIRLDETVFTKPHDPSQYNCNCN